MSTPTVPPVDVATSDLDGIVESIQRELGDYFSPGAFPATVDELQASLIRRRAPARLLWSLSGLSPVRRYSSLAAVLHDLEQPTTSGWSRGPI